MKGIYWLFYLLFVLGFGVISCSGDDPIVDSEGNIGSNGDDESNGEENGSPDTGVKTLDYGELFAFLMLKVMVAMQPVAAEVLYML